MSADTCEQYLVWLRQQQRLAPHSLAAAQRDLNRLQELLGSRGMPDWSSISADDMRRALSQARVEGAGAATLARMTSSWRGFFRYLDEQGINRTFPLEGIRAPRKPRRLPKALSPDEAHRLLQASPGVQGSGAGNGVAADADANAYNKANVQDVNANTLLMALAELLYGSGLRISEALGIDRSERDFHARRQMGVIGGWIDWASGELHLIGKGSKPRVVPLTSVAAQRLRDWLATPVVWPPGYDERPLFVSPRGQRLPVRSAQRMLATLAVQAGLDRHVHPHMLRHSFASHVLQSSGDLRAVQELMGHASIASTQVYTALDFQHLSAAYDKAHPRARKKTV